MPESKNRDVEAAELKQVAAVSSKAAVRRHALLLQHPYVSAIAIRILGREADGVTSLPKELDQVKQTPRSTLAVEFRHQGRGDQRPRSGLGTHHLGPWRTASKCQMRGL